MLMAVKIAYIGAVHIVDGIPEYWIGMFFPADTEVDFEENQIEITI